MKAFHYRPIWAQINLKNLDYNFNLVRKLVGPAVKILVPVKAHAYGHGLIRVSKRLEKLGVDYLGVASVDEGVVLREMRIVKPVLVLGTIRPDDAAPVLEYRLAQAICSKDVAVTLDRLARKKRAQAVVHIKIDTGMHRLGVPYAEAEDFIIYVSSLKNVVIEGLFTHFPCADTDPDFTQEQIRLFRGLVSKIRKSKLRIPFIHTANSLGVIDFPEGHFTMVRPGLMLYGLYPKLLSFKLKPLLTLKTKVVHIMTVAKGKGISYGHTYVTTRKTRVATLSVGYGDGYPRCLSNKADCLIGGKRAPLIGRICMDQTMADVTDIPGVRVDDEAVLIGSQKTEAISVEELAAYAQTIPYEIVCNLGTRIKWEYSE